MIAAARDRGLLLLSAGTYGNVIRFLMPLTIADEVLDEGLAILADSLGTITDSGTPPAARPPADFPSG